MWDKDKEIGDRPEDAFGLDSPFVLLSAALNGEKITTRLGPADVAVLVGRPITPGGLGPVRTAKTVASAIVDKIKLAAEGDFPAVVELRRVKTPRSDSALVIQFVGEWTGEVPA